MRHAAAVKHDRGWRTGVDCVSGGTGLRGTVVVFKNGAPHWGPARDSAFSKMAAVTPGGRCAINPGVPRAPDPAFPARSKTTTNRETVCVFQRD